MAKKGASKKKAVKPAVKPAKTPAAGPPKLEKQVLTELLRDIEAKGVPYEEIVLADLLLLMFGRPSFWFLTLCAQKE